jgi:hypothetical protein
MSKSVLWKDDQCTIFTGRKGTEKCIGLEVSANVEDTITITPIDAKTMLGKCQITIPLADVKRIVKALREVGS